jgi:hypothetical protein
MEKWPIWIDWHLIRDFLRRSGVKEGVAGAVGDESLGRKARRIADITSTALRR